VVTVSVKSRLAGRSKSNRTGTNPRARSAPATDHSQLSSPPLVHLAIQPSFVTEMTAHNQPPTHPEGERDATHASASHIGQSCATDAAVSMTIVTSLSCTCCKFQP
jgi:hypothetical protein